MSNSDFSQHALDARDYLLTPRHLLPLPPPNQFSSPGSVSLEEKPQVADNLAAIFKSGRTVVVSLDHVHAAASSGFGSAGTVSMPQRWYRLAQTYLNASPFVRACK